MADVPYDPTVWVNGVGGHTPVDANRLNKLENAVQQISINKLSQAAVDTRVNTILASALLNN